MKSSFNELKSFQVHETVEILAFWEKYGVVVIENVVDQQQIESTIDEIWKIIDSSSEGKVKRDDPTTWEDEYWPDKTKKGFIQPFSEFKWKEMWLNRQNPNIIKAFEVILGQQEINVSRDRYGVMRPTKGIVLPDGTTIDREEHKTDSNWLHWDQNGWANNSFQGVQGLLTLSDHTDKSGGFHCVPGFTHEFKQWFSLHSQQTHPNDFDGLVEVPVGDPIRERIANINCNAGSLVIWDSRIPHGNFPNNNSSFRMVQYITFSPHDKAKFEHRKENLGKETQNAYRLYGDEWDKNIPTWENQLPNYLSPLGKKVVGFESW